MTSDRVYVLRLALRTYRDDWFDALCACDAAGVARALQRAAALITDYDAAHECLREEEREP